MGTSTVKAYDIHRIQGNTCTCICITLQKIFLLSWTTPAEFLLPSELRNLVTNASVYISHYMIMVTCIKVKISGEVETSQILGKKIFRVPQRESNP